MSRLALSELLEELQLLSFEMIRHLGLDPRVRWIFEFNEIFPQSIDKHHDHLAVVMNSGLWGWGLIGQDCFLPEETLQCELNRQEEQSRGESDLPQFVNVHCFIN